jgi:hypothetical protein
MRKHGQGNAYKTIPLAVEKEQLYACQIIYRSKTTHKHRGAENGIIE